MPDRSRIPRDIKRFAPYMQSTDKYQLTIDPSTMNPNYLRWKWTAAHSAAWSGFRQRADEYFAQYNTKAFRNDDVTKKLHLLRKEVAAYDKKHHLLNRISIYAGPSAPLTDFEIFRVKRGTPLERKQTHSHVDPPVPVVSVREIQHLTHRLRIANPAHSGRGRGDKIKYIQVWMAITEAGAKEPPASAYQYIGDADYGFYVSMLEQKHNRKDAWYKARMKTTRGKYGLFSRAVCAPII
jgi:hypothetical protein